MKHEQNLKWNDELQKINQQTGNIDVERKIEKNRMMSYSVNDVSEDLKVKIVFQLSNLGVWGEVEIFEPISLRLRGKDVTKWEVVKKSFVNYSLIKGLGILVFRNLISSYIITRKTMRSVKLNDRLASKKQLLLN
jgi:hypothetical protein